MKIKEKQITILIFFFIVIFLNFSGLLFFKKQLIPQEKIPEKIIRPAAAAGQFYPADPQELERTVEWLLEKAQPPRVEGEIIALILPHAGYQFSGRVAAFGFKTLTNQKIDTVVLIGDSHYERFEGISVFAAGYFETPLGRIEVDSNLAKSLIQENSKIFFKESTHSKEHSLEVELPFLQKTLKNFKIVPILFGNLGLENYQILAQAILKNIKEKNVLLVASSDLSHYLSYQDTKYVDKKTIGAILTGDVENLEKTINDLEKEKISNAITFACGEEAIKTVMVVAKELGAKEIRLLSYANSGDFSGDLSRVVGYATIGFFGQRKGELY